ncbi:unnamed protein product [Ascophyllum nodosum]
MLRRFRCVLIFLLKPHKKHEMFMSLEPRFTPSRFDNECLPLTGWMLRRFRCVSSDFSLNESTGASWTAYYQQSVQQRSLNFRCCRIHCVPCSRHRRRRGRE